MADSVGLYLSNGRQSTGAAFKQGKVDCDIYDYDGSKNIKIYPRNVSTTIKSSAWGGSFTLNTYRDSNYGTRSGMAYQGCKSNGYSKTQVHRCWGKMAASKIPSYKNIQSVDYVEIICMAPTGVGIEQDRTVVFHSMLKEGSAEPTLGEKSCKFIYKKSWLNKKVTINSDDCSGLKAVVLEVLQNKGKGFCLYNGEDKSNLNFTYDDGTGYGSTNYMRFDYFEVSELKITYQA